jgi:hypothetical protein
VPGPRGFSNATLAALLGLLALIGALAMIQSGQLDFSGLAPSPAPAASGGKRASKGNPPKLLPRSPAPAPRPVLMADNHGSAAALRSPRRELYQALPRMDADAAARMLAEMDIGEVVLLLGQLTERDLARILEAASPLDSSRWVAAMLEILPPLERIEESEERADSNLEEDSTPAPTAGEGGESETQNGNAAESETGSGGNNQAESEDGADANQAPADNGSTASATAPVLPPGSNTV